MTQPVIIQGPLAPLDAVPVCDLGGEPLARDQHWWLVAISAPGDTNDRHAACARHTGVPPLPYTAHKGAPRDPYSRAVEALADEWRGSAAPAFQRRAAEYAAAVNQTA